jgi:CheY-like chemotaxis protein
VKAMEFVFAGNPVETTLVAALQQPNAEVRTQAAFAIAKINPQRSYRGSSRFVGVLVDTLSTAGTARIVVGHPNQTYGERIAGAFNALGYETVVGHNCREVFALASANPDCEMIVLDAVLKRPDALELIQQIRQNQKLSRIPVGIFGEDILQDKINQYVVGDRLTRNIPLPMSADGAKFAVEKLSQLQVHPPKSPAVRFAEAGLALDILHAIARQSEKYRFYNWVQPTDRYVKALSHPELSVKAAEMLGLVGNAQAQKELVDLASVTGSSIEVRQAAANAFKAAIKQRGTLLTTIEIKEQYNRYNQSENEDAAVQAVLSGILDAIESNAGLVKNQDAAQH